MKYLSFCYRERKKQVKCRGGEGEMKVSVFSVIARVRINGSFFQSFFFRRLDGGLVLVRIGGCP